MCQLLWLLWLDPTALQELTGYVASKYIACRNGSPAASRGGVAIGKS